MRAQFIRGGDPKETMDIGAYRTDAPNRDIFKRMHELAKDCPIFSNVTDIDYDKVEPSFKIYSTKISRQKPAFKEEFTIYLTGEEGTDTFGMIIMFDDITDDEYQDLTLKEFQKITSCTRRIK